MTEPLKKGDLFHIVAASSPISDKEDLLSGIKVLQEWGLKCTHFDGVDRSWGYLAGSDEVRFNELHPKERFPLIAFARGGWGSARLLEMSSYSVEELRKNVTSPGGTTEAALEILLNKKNGLEIILQNALNAAIIRAEKLNTK